MIKKEAKTAVIFVTDEGFLFPTIFAAKQITPHIQSAYSGIDILIFLINIQQNLIDKLNDNLKFFNITFIPLDPASLNFNQEVIFRTTHVPKSTLGRLGICKTLPQQYKTLIYLDGDIYIQNNIQNLLDYTPEEGKILAATEGLWLYPKKQASLTKYMEGIGIKNPTDYFNAGVFSVSTSTWRTASEAALHFFLKNPEKCLFHDQSALNYIFKEKREILSPIYNYTSLYDQISPAFDNQIKIRHFTGREKPWLYNNRIYNNPYSDKYTDLLNDLDFLKPTIPIPTPKMKTKVFIDSFFKKNIHLYKKVKERKLLSDYLNNPSTFAVS